MIKKCLYLLFAWLCVAVSGAAYAQEGPSPKIQVVYFGSPYCLHCRDMEKDFLDGFLERNQDKIQFVRIDVTKHNLAFLQAMQAYGVERGGTPAMAIGNEWLMGYPRDIGERADLAVSKALINQETTHVNLPKELLEEFKSPASTKIEPEENPRAAQAPVVEKTPAPKPAPKTNLVNQVEKEASVTLPKETAETAKNESLPSAQKEAKAASDSLPASHQEVFNRLTFWMIAGAGLVDGINPCAFAVIVFFISFLSVYKYEKREIIAVGTAYCAAVFIAYVLLGLGAFQFLYALQGFYYVMWGLKIITVALCVVFLLLSAYDCWHYYRTKDASGLILQLPVKYKTFIHKVMHTFLKDRSKSTWRLGAAALVVGFVVSLVEAVCTGQVYLPTIVVVLKEAGDNFWRAAEFLLVYNVMFIVPLVLVFGLALAGYESSTFGGWLKKHLGLAKILLCGVFLVLLVLLLQNW